MADDEEGAIIGFEGRLQRFNRVHVEMIGRLVQQEHLRRFRRGEDGCEAGAQAFPAAERCDGLQRSLVPEGEAGEGGMGFILCQVRLDGPDRVEDRAARGQQADMLVEPGDAARERVDDAGGGGDLAKDHAHQRRLSGAIRAGKGDPLGSSYVEAERAEQGAVAEGGDGLGHAQDVL